MCLAIFAGFTLGILSPYSRLYRLICGYIVNKMQPEYEVGAKSGWGEGGGRNGDGGRVRERARL